MGVGVRVEDGSLLALNMDEGAASHGIQAAYRNWERPGADSLPGHPEGTTAANTLILTQ